MATIIKAGDDSKAIPGWVGTQLSCKKCGCIWKLDKNDAVSHHSREPDIATATCPTCNTNRTFRDSSMGR